MQQTCFSFFGEFQQQVAGFRSAIDVQCRYPQIVTEYMTNMKNNVMAMATQGTTGAIIQLNTTQRHDVVNCDVEQSFAALRESCLKWRMGRLVGM